MPESNGNSEHASLVLGLIENVQYFAVQDILLILENILNNFSCLFYVFIRNRC